MIKEKIVAIKNYFSSWTKFQIWLGIVFAIVLFAGGVSAFYNNQESKKTISNIEANIVETNSDNRNSNTDNSTTSTNQSGSPVSSSSISKLNSTQGPSGSNEAPSGEGSNGNSGSPPTDSPSAPDSLSATVAFYADSQTDNNPVGEDENHQKAVNYILGTNADPVFHAGDLMEDGTQASLDSFNAVTATLRASRSFYAAQGNNERDSSLFFNNFIFPNNERWYSVDVGNLHMVVLDSAYSSTSSDQLNWLVSDLQSSASQSRLTGVMFHHPIYPNNDKNMRASYESVFINNGVDFVLSGHNHSYYHSTVSGVNYFVCSGQQSIGYLLAKVYSGTISISAYNSSNGLIETISILNR